jgi:hypothetical protein
MAKTRRKKIPAEIRRRVAAMSQHRCGYCLTAQEFTAMPMQIEHLIPLAEGGSNDESNLWLACPLCNGAKSAQTHHLDPISQENALLYNPRHQAWEAHFKWSEDGTHILGITPTGRCTILALNMNNEFVVRARRRWVMAGWHPPEE